MLFRPLVVALAITGGLTGCTETQAEGSKPHYSNDIHTKSGHTVPQFIGKPSSSGKDDTVPKAPLPGVNGQVPGGWAVIQIGPLGKN